MTAYSNVFLCVITLTLGVICVNGTGETANLFSSISSGDGTYYGVVTDGACSLGPWPAWTTPLIKVAMNAPQYFGSEACGICVNVSGGLQGSGADPWVGLPRIAYVTDLCPECSSGDLDRVGNGDGRWKISFRAIPCPLGTARITYMFEGSNPYYLKLQVRSHLVPVKSVEVQRSGQWIAGVRSSDNHFVWLNQGQFSAPLTVRLTSVANEQLTDCVPKIGANGEELKSCLQGGSGVQFSVVPGGGSVPSASRTASSSSRTPSSSSGASPSPSPAPRLEYLTLVYPNASESDVRQLLSRVGYGNVDFDVTAVSGSNSEFVISAPASEFSASALRNSILADNQFVSAGGQASVGNNSMSSSASRLLALAEATVATIIFATAALIA